MCKVTRTHWKCCSHIWKYFLKQKTFKVSGFKHSWAFFAPKSKLMLFIIKWRKDHKQPSPFRMLPGDLLNRSLFFIIYTVFPAFCTTERGVLTSFGYKNNEVTIWGSVRYFLVSWKSYISKGLDCARLPF